MHEFEHDMKLDVEARVRQGVKAILEEVLEEEMSEHLKEPATGSSPLPGEESAMVDPISATSDPRGQDRAPYGAPRPGGRVRHRSLRALQAHDRGRRRGSTRDVPLWDLGQEDSRRHRRTEQGEDR